jgi:hypothetical protein
MMKRPANDGKRVISQDLTGHVTMTSEQSRAYMHSLERTAAINGKIKSGTITYKQTRNPLRAEPTPRVDYKGFNYNPPEAPPVKERWIYPETDWGLMLKFSSQKAIYQELEETAKRCDDRIREFKSKQSESALNSGRQTGAMTQRTARTPKMESARDNEMTESARNFLENSASFQTLERKPSARPDESATKNIQALKILRTKNHPEIVEKYRADRAAEFIRHQKHAFDAPTARPLPDSDFKPGGGIVNMDRVRDERAARQAELKSMKRGRMGGSGAAVMGSGSARTKEAPVDTGRLKEQLSTLLDQLNQTEDELGRQELKIALNHKTYNYERQKKKK